MRPAPILFARLHAMQMLTVMMEMNSLPTRVLIQEHVRLTVTIVVRVRNALRIQIAMTQTAQQQICALIREPVIQAV